MADKPTFKELEQRVKALEREAAECKRAEEALRQSQNQYKTLVEGLPQKIFHKDRDSIYVSCNEKYARDLKIKPGEIIGRTDYDFFPKELAEKYRADDKRIIASGKTEVLEEKYFRHGQEVFVQTVKTPIKDKKDNVVGVLGIFWDITDHRLTEKALRKSEEKYSTLVESSLTGIYIDQDRKVVFANKRFAEIYGYSKDDLSGLETWKLVHPEDRVLTDEIRSKRLNGQEAPSEYEARGMTKDGETIWVLRRNTRIEYRGRPAVLGNVVDVTQRRRAEQALRDSETEQKRRHQELEAVNGILVKVTKEYDLNGMGHVLQNTMEEFYPGADVLLYLLSPNRDGLYFPTGGGGQNRETCFDRARKRIETHALEQSLLAVLIMEGLKPACSAKATDCPAIIQDLVAGYVSWMAVPIEMEDVCQGLFIVGSASKDIHVEEELVFIESLISQISGVIRNQVAKEAREDAFRRQLAGPDKFVGIVGRSKPMQEIYQLITAVAYSESTVLITGESGTGKELVARAIHQAGKYKDAPFIAAHCSSFVPTLVHSELFGHEKGAFTGASRRKLGRLERAQGGILFLDEVADLPLETQVLLLRFLQDKSFERVGGQRPVQVDARIIAATNRQIEKDVERGRLREDFYYRLNVVRVRVPPLRERVSDLPLLANHFLRTYCLIEGKEISGFDNDAMRLIMDYGWPGNVRELQNTVARCVVLSSGGSISAEDLAQTAWSPGRVPVEYALAKNERELILSVMEKCNWNKRKAARLLEISRGTLYSKLKKYNIRQQGGT